jgi:hypothetical protein
VCLSAAGEPTTGEEAEANSVLLIASRIYQQGVGAAVGSIILADEARPFISQTCAVGEAVVAVAKH